jgi:ABC-2 type transport system permease protein
MRYLRLYANFVRFSFSKAMEFRVDFFFRVLMDAVFYATQLIFFGVLYGHTQELGGWNLGQTLIFISGFFMVDALHMTLFSNNMWMLPILVNKGDLDYYLLRPVSSLFFLSLREFAANSFLNLAIAVGVWCWALFSYPEPVTPSRLLVYLLLLVNGTVIYYVLHLAFLIPVFWLHSARGLGEIFFSLAHYAERPERIFAGYLRRLLVSLLPLSLVASRPAQQYFDGPDAPTLLHLGAVTALGFAFLVWFWKRALRSYSSASS